MCNFVYAPCIKCKRKAWLEDIKNAVPIKNFIIPAGYSFDEFWHSICKQGWPDGL